MSDLDVTNEWPSRFADKVDGADGWEIPDAISINLRRVYPGRLPGGDHADADQTDNLVYLLARRIEDLSARIDRLTARLDAQEGPTQ